MAEKFKFDKENLEIKEQNKFEQILKIILADFVLIFLITIIAYLVYSYSFESQEEKDLKAQNKILKKEFENSYKLYLKNENELRKLEQQDSNLYKVLFLSDPDSKIENRIIDISDLKGRNAVVQAKKNDKNLKQFITDLKAKNQKFINIWDSVELKDINNIPTIIPIPRIANKEFLIYGFGIKMNIIYGINQFHKGIDIDATYNTPVLSTMNGKVIKTASNRTKGKYIIIQNGNYKTGFYHLEDIKVKQGQKVSKGQLIGTVGVSGRSLLPHLHYEVQYKDQYVNPIFFIFMSVSPQEYSKIYKRSIFTGISLD